MKNIIEIKNRGQLTVTAWTVYGALDATQSACPETRKNAVKDAIAFQKDNFSKDDLKALELKYFAVCGDVGLSLKDCIDIAHNRQPKGINIPSNHLNLFAISNDNQKNR